MQRYHLGSEQATRALTVSLTLDHVMSTRDVSWTDALSELIHHIHRAKHTRADPYDSSSDESDAPAPSVDYALNKENLTSRQQNQKLNQNSSAVVTRSGRKRLADELKVSTKIKKNKIASTSGVINKIKVEQTKRERSDSANEEVAAKLNCEAVSSANHSIRAPNGNKSGVSTPLVGRSKRSRVAGEEVDSDLSGGINSKLSRA
jgi:hypothetical protein